MSVLHFDFETSGIYLNGVPSDDPSQPRALSLSAILDDDDGRTRGAMSMIVKPEGWSIDERLKGDDGKPTAFSINGISNAMANRYGRPLAEVMREFRAMAEMADTLIAFSAFFDCKFIKICCAHLGDPGKELRAFFATKQSICTMESAAKYLGGPRERFVKLAVAFKNLHGRDFDGAHNSLADANASRMVYAKLKDFNALQPPKSMAEKEYSTPYQRGEAKTSKAAVAEVEF